VVEAGDEKKGSPVDRAVRYRRLEIIREFAREKLIQATEAGRLMDRHLEYFLKKAEEIEPYLYGPEQTIWMDVLEGEFDDIRLALEWSIANQKGEQAVRLFSAIGWYWFIRCRFREGEEWFKRIQPFVARASKRKQAGALRSASWLYYARDDFTTTLRMHSQCLDLYRELGDEAEMSACLQYIGVMQFSLGSLAEAKSSLEKSLELSRKVNNKAAMPRALIHMGYFAEMNGETEVAKRYFEESVAVGREVGEGHLLMMVLGNMGNFWYAQQNYAFARQYYREALEIGLRLKNKRTIAEELLYYAEILNAELMFQESARLQGFAESLFAESETLTESHIGAINKAAEIPRRHLGDLVYQREYNTGKSLTMDQAVGIALHL
jgi:tetratricopeptide (TPR) repeat protein